MTKEMFTWKKPATAYSSCVWLGRQVTHAFLSRWSDGQQRVIAYLVANSKKIEK